MNPVLLVLGHIWALPTTLLGMVLGMLAGCQPVKVIDPEKAWVWHVHPDSIVGWLFDKWPKFKIGAQTVGVIIVVEPDCDPVLLPHERGHVRQAFVLGPLYLPAYGLGCLWGLLVHGDAYNGNPMEQLAVKFGETHK